MNTVKCIPVSVYRSHLGDCTNGGISANHDTLYLECDHGYLDMDPGDPTCLRVVERNLFGSTYRHAESYCGKAAMFAGDAGKTVGPMMGGNFVYSSDSRFPADYPLPLHDRYETPEQYEAFSH